MYVWHYIEGLVQERQNSSVLAMELHFSGLYTGYFEDCQTAVLEMDYLPAILGTISWSLPSLPQLLQHH